MSKPNITPLGDRVLVQSVEVEIGGQKIDKHYGDWLHVWNELTQTPGHAAGYANMVGNVPALTQVYHGGNGANVAGAKVPATTLYIPLEFWFCRNPGLALPLIALKKLHLPFQLLTDLPDPFLFLFLVFVQYLKKIVLF